MRIEIVLNFMILILGILVAIAGWTFAPVCAIEMRCYFTRDVETVLGISIAVLAVIGMYRGLEQ